MFSFVKHPLNKYNVLTNSVFPVSNKTTIIVHVYDVCPIYCKTSSQTFEIG